jgi:4-amino-4-deoxy-L-arabinose transferase-like glycosyltransferase
MQPEAHRSETSTPQAASRTAGCSDRVAALLWLLAALFGVLAGRWMLAQALAEGDPARPPWAALAALALAALALWVGRRTVAAPDADAGLLPRAPLLALPPAWTAFWRRYWRLPALGAATLCAAFPLWRIPQLGPQASYTAVFCSWLAGIVLFSTAVAERPAFPPSWRAWITARRPLLLAVGATALLALLLRVWRLDAIPFTLGGDEGSQGLEALRVLVGDLRNPFTTGWLGVPTMSFFFNSLAIQYLGPTVTALRLPWALVGAATVVVAFLLVRQMVGARLGLATAVLLAVYHYHIHFSRLGSNQVADPFFLALALFLLYRALDGRARLNWALLGAVTGLAFYFYAGARLTPVVIVAVLGYLFVLEPRVFVRRHGWGLLVAAGAFVLTAAPMLQYAWRFPDEFNARLNTVGVFQSGWLAREIDIRGESAVAILFDQFRRAALAFNFYPDRTVWYGLREPLLNPFFGSLFVLGLLYGTFTLLDRAVGRRVAPMVAWWWGGMLLGGMLTESPPSSQRLVTLAVPVCFFLALALLELARLARQALARQAAGRAARAPWVTNGVLAAGVLLFAAYSLTTYFVDFTPQRLYGGQNAELATQIAPRLNELKYEHRFYFVGPPWMYWGFATLPYLVPRADAIDVPQPLPDPLPETWLPPDKGAVFIVIPPRMDELAILARAFPQGVRENVYSPVDGRLMVVLYRITP